MDYDYAETLPEKLAWRYREYSFRLRRWLADRGVIQSGKDYTPFVLLCDTRTGSTMLASMLRHHPDVLMFSELFRADMWDRVPFREDGFRRRSRDPEVRRLRKNDPVKFLKEEIFRSWPASIDAVGFKLMYSHGRVQPMWWDDPDDEERWNPGRKVFWRARSDPWEYIYNDEEIKVIHLTRRNYLNRVLSIVRAKRTGEWEVKKGKTSERREVYIDPEYCKYEFEIYERKINKEEEKLSKKDRIKIEYENLKSKKEKEIERVRKNIGVSKRKMSPSTKKQIKKSNSKAIQKYEELESYFEETKWSKFFE
jgi:hypothetical protein